MNLDIPMSFPLPHLESVFDAIGEAKAQYFSSVDLKSGFWQIPLDPSTQHKAAFITQNGVYEWTRLPFGLMNAPISFQTLMTSILRGMNWKSVLVYVDDILIFSESFEKHLSHISQVFERLEKFNLKLHPDKCQFAMKFFLGHIISKDGVEVDPEKTKVMDEFPRPKTQTQVRSFIGLANYYRKFIANFSKIAAPLNALMSKDVKFCWSEDCEKAFDELKKKLVSAPILSYPDSSKQFTLTCDASDKAISYILGQKDSEGRHHVIAYGGRSLNKSERAWNITDKECLAILCGVKAYHPYLASGKFTVYTDHKALCWLKSSNTSETRLQRWAIKLQNYNYDILHKPGKTNVADALSRREYPESNDVHISSISENQSSTDFNFSSGQDIFSQLPETSQDNVINYISVEEDIESQDDKLDDTVYISAENDNTVSAEGVAVQFFYPDEEPAIVAAIQNDPLENALNDTEILFQLQQESPDFKFIIAYLLTGDLPVDEKDRNKCVAEAERYQILNGLFYHFVQRRCKQQPTEHKFTKQLCIPKALRKDVLRSYHDGMAGGGHLGICKTHDSIRSKFWWSTIYADVENYVKCCNRCQMAKRNFNKFNPPLTSMPQVGRFERWQIDILGPIQKSLEGYQYVLLAIDSFTRFPEAFPLKTVFKGNNQGYLQ